MQQPIICIGLILTVFTLINREKTGKIFFFFGFGAGWPLSMRRRFYDRSVLTENLNI